MTIPAIEAFERRYADRSGVSVDFLHTWGRFGAPCDCDEDACEGFQMLHLRDDLLEAGWQPPPDGATIAGEPPRKWGRRRDDEPSHNACLAVRPISEGGDTGPMLCSRAHGHHGEHRNRYFQWRATPSTVPETPSDGDSTPGDRAPSEPGVDALRQEIEEYVLILARQSELLTGVANALKGPPAERSMHDWSDLPGVAQELVARLGAYGAS